MMLGFDKQLPKPITQLDEQQKKPANHFGHNALVLAGAGSGKTAVLTQRGANLVERGLDPNRMCMFTFTNKASKEMRSRMIDLFIQRNINKDLPNITTFHQYGYKLIKQYSEECLRPEGQPSIMSVKEAKSEWVTALLEVGYTKDNFKEDPFYIDLPGLAANKGIVLMDNEKSFQEFHALCADHDKASEYELLAGAMIGYTESKINQNLLDFDDMILLPIFLLESYPQIRNSISEHLIDVAVDESQDNNGAQYKLLKLLTDTGRKVHTMMVGDDDQGIYEWRGAEPANIKGYLKDFNAELFLLEKNYRSKEDIVAGAGRIVANNKSRIAKTPYATRKADAPIETYAFKGKVESDSVFYMESNDAVHLGHKLAAMFKERRDNGEDLSDIAILYRTQKMGYFLDKTLSSHGLLTNMMSGTGLMERQEVLMAIAALRFCVNPYDGRAFNRLSNLVPGLGVTGVSKIIEAAISQKKPLLPDSITGLTAKQARNLAQLDEIINPLREGPTGLKAWSDIHLVPWLRREHMADAKKEAVEGKIEDTEDSKESRTVNLIIASLGNVAVIQDSIEHELEKGDYVGNEWEVITELSLDAPQEKKEVDGIKLSTIHGFKGLECKEVHIAGFSHGLMPKCNSEGVVENAEEERRLAYVAITRAEDRLYLHHVKKFDFISGGRSYDAPKLKPSIYIKELRGTKLLNDLDASKPKKLDFSLFYK